MDKKLETIIEETILKELFMVDNLYNEACKGKEKFIKYIRDILKEGKYKNIKNTQITNALLSLYEKDLIIIGEGNSYVSNRIFDKRLLINSTPIKIIYELCDKGEDYVFDNNVITIHELSQHCENEREKLNEKVCNNSKIIESIKKEFEELKNNNIALNRKIEELNENLDKSTKIINEHEENIKSFNNNILTIMSILIAAFSIIGFNIGGIRFLVENQSSIKPWEYAGCIIVINLSIVISLYFLFYMLNKVVNYNVKSEKTNIFNKKLCILIGTIMLIILAACFIIA